MDRSLRITLIAASLVAGIGMAFAVCAQQTVAADAQVRTDAGEADAQANAVASADGQPDPKNANCLKETGTHIRARDPRTGKPLCQGPGRAYSREQIDRTGQTDLADALRRLDPSVR